MQLAAPVASPDDGGCVSTGTVAREWFSDVDWAQIGTLFLKWVVQARYMFGNKLRWVFNRTCNRHYINHRGFFYWQREPQLLSLVLAWVPVGSSWARNSNISDLLPFAQQLETPDRQHGGSGGGLVSASLHHLHASQRTC
jgi:protein-S-isoprenylcysteine O-methyltransferase Ste14